MSEFVYNDIYGNEGASNRYQSDSRYAYYNTILHMHNRYFENSSLHEKIFCRPQPEPLFISPRPHTNRQRYSLEKINNLTFRISKARKTIEGPKHEPTPKKTHSITRDAADLRKAIKSDFRKSPPRYSPRVTVEAHTLIHRQGFP